MKQFIFALIFIMILATDYVAVFGQDFQDDDPQFIQEKMEKQREDEIRAEMYQQAFADIRDLSALVWAEAGNQPIEGQLAVAIVVNNRTKHPQFEDTVSQVIAEPHQFGPYSNGSWDTGKQMYDQGLIPASCVYVALQALSGTTDIVWNGELIDFSQMLYFNTSVSHPKVTIQDHSFR